MLMLMRMRMGFWSKRVYAPRSLTRSLKCLALLLPNGCHVAECRVRVRYNTFHGWTVNKNHGLYVSPSSPDSFPSATIFLYEWWDRVENPGYLVWRHLAVLHAAHLAAFTEALQPKS
jgi:hypothetical protein